MEQKQSNNQQSEYVIEMSWGCPSEQYPLNGIFQFDQAKALRSIGENVIYVALDMRSLRKRRKWGINNTIINGIEVYEYNFPFGPLFKSLRYYIEEKCFIRLMREIERRRGLPKCFHIHNCTIAVSAMKYCQKKKIPYIITEHSKPVIEGKRRERKKADTYKNAKKVIAVSRVLSAQLASRYEISTIVIPNTLDLSQFKYKKIDSTHKNFRFISAARVDGGKGFDILLKAFAKVVKEVADCELQIMGDGPCLKTIRELAADLNIADKVIFWGGYVRSEFSEELSKSDCFVLASKSETFGIVYIEAMACGVPVIATRCGGPEDFVNPLNGMLVPVDDVDDLSMAMIKMKNCINVYDSKVISNNCKQQFSPGKIAGDIKKVLEVVLD